MNRTVEARLRKLEARTPAKRMRYVFWTTSDQAEWERGECRHNHHPLKLGSHWAGRHARNVCSMTKQELLQHGFERVNRHRANPLTLNPRA